MSLGRTAAALLGIVALAACAFEPPGAAGNDASGLDAATPVDGGGAETGPHMDAEPADAGKDTGIDAEGLDGAVIDGDLADSAPEDAEPADVGPPDSGPPDSGPNDAGCLPPSAQENRSFDAHQDPARLIRFGRDPIFGLDGAFTLSFAVKARDDNLEETAVLARLARDGNQAPADGWELHIAPDPVTNGTLLLWFRAYRSGALGLELSAPGALIVNEWHHVAVVGTRSSTGASAHLFIDGGLVDSTSSTVSFGLGDAELEVPGHATPDRIRFRIDDLHFADRRTIAGDFNPSDVTPATAGAGSVGLWSMDESGGSNQVVVDSMCRNHGLAPAGDFNNDNATSRF